MPVCLWLGMWNRCHLGRQPWFCQTNIPECFSKKSWSGCALDSKRQTFLSCCLVSGLNWSKTSWKYSFKISKSALAMVSRYCILSWTKPCALAFIKHFGCSKLGTLEQTGTEQGTRQATRTDFSCRRVNYSFQNNFHSQTCYGTGRNDLHAIQ